MFCPRERGWRRGRERRSGPIGWVGSYGEERGGGEFTHARREVRSARMEEICMFFYFPFPSTLGRCEMESVRTWTCSSMTSKL